MLTVTDRDGVEAISASDNAVDAGYALRTHLFDTACDDYAIPVIAWFTCSALPTFEILNGREVETWTWTGNPR